MLFKEAVAKRIYELCQINKISPNKLAELSAVPPSTLQGITACKIANPSSYVLYRLSKTLNISLNEFFESEMFNNLED